MLKSTKASLSKSGKDNKEVLQYQDLPYVSKILRFKLINYYHNDLLIKNVKINKRQELFAKKYYRPTLYRNIQTYVRGCNLCLAFKALYHKPYRDLQLLPVVTHYWRNLSMDFVTGLTLSANWKGNNYDLFLIIVDYLTKIIYYKSVKVTINTSRLAKVIINVVIRYYGLPDTNIHNCRTIFIFKVWSLLYYFLDIKKQLSITFYL